MRQILLLLFVSVLSMNINAQTYESLWKKVDKAADDDLPKQVIAEAENILKKAQKEKNFAQEMKAWVTIVNHTRSMSPDSLDVLTPPDYKQTATNDAVVNALMATGIKEKRNMRNRSRDYAKEADSLRLYYYNKVLENKEALYETKVDDYLPLITKGEDGRLYDNDMLSVMADFVLDNAPHHSLAPRHQLCKEVAEFYKEKGNLNAYALWSISDISLNALLSRKDKEAALQALLEETKDVEAGADVAEAYYSEHFLFKPDMQDTKLKEKLAFIRKWKARYPKYAYFINKEQELTNPRCRISSDSNSEILPDVSFPITIKTLNMSELTLEVRLFNGRDKNDRLRTDGKLITTLHHSFEKKEDEYTLVNDSLKLPAEQYVLIAKGDGISDITHLYITSLQLALFEIAEKKYLAVVLDRINGTPVSGATVTAQNTSDNSKVIIQKTDKNGEITFDFTNSKRASSWIFTASLSYRNETVGEFLYISNRNNSETKQDTYFNIEIDRPVYRPGQTVKVGVVAYTKDDNGSLRQTQNQLSSSANYNENENKVPKDIFKAFGNKSLDVTLKAPNTRDDVEKKKVETNSFGTASCEFTIPKDAEPGRYSIRVRYNDDNFDWYFFQVEEYKRPTFYVECLNEKNDSTETTSFTLNDTVPVVIQAKTYAGVPVQGAKVKYTIQWGRGNFWRPWDFNVEDDEIATGECFTDENGKATIPMFLEDQEEIFNDFSEEDDNRFNKKVERFKAQYEVTDLAGETHEGSYTVGVSNEAFGIKVETDYRQINDIADIDSIKVCAINAEGKDVRKEEVRNPRYEILFINSKKDTTVIASDTWVPNEKMRVPDLPAGNYKIQFTATDKNNRSIKDFYDLIQFKPQNALIPGKTAGKDTNECMFAQAHTHIYNVEFSEDKPGTIYYAPAEGNTIVYALIASGGEVIERTKYVLDKHVYKLEFPYKKAYGDGICVTLYSMKNGKFERANQTFRYKHPDKELKLSWKTFRDRLTPGQNEEWTLTVRDKNGKSVTDAEMMATMYDASLDEITEPLSWHFGLNIYRNVPWTSMSSSTADNYIYWSFDKDYKSLPLGRNFNYLSVFFDYGNYWTARPMMKSVSAAGLPAIGAAEMRVATQSAKTTNTAVYSEETADNALQGSIAGLDVVLDSERLEESPINSSGTVKPRIRSNFAENAFFYPNLISNKDGEIKISFSLPETLTEWKFLGFVHTKDMNHATIEARAVARQEFIVQPNMPRFIREGDDVTIVSRIINQSDKEIHGNALLRLTNAETNEVILTQELPFTAKANATEPVLFHIHNSLIPNSKFLIPNFPTLICEISASSSSFSDGERNYIQYLPSKQFITETVPFFLENESSKVIDLHTLYNNGSSTATDKKLSLTFTGNPSELVFDALEAMKVPENDNAPCHAASLYANSMLKRIGTDSDSIDIYLKKAEEKLISLQNPDGSWSWFEGMPGSYYITLAVCENLAMLHNAQFSVLNSQLNKAMDNLDAYELKAFNDIKKQAHPSFVPSESTLHYLYIYTMLPDRTMSKEVKKMCNTYLKEFQKRSKYLTIYGKANGSNILRHNGFTKPAEKFLQSVLEYSIYKPGMGRYFDTKKATYSWRDYKIPTQLAAMRATKDKQTLNEMMIWLLRQKQVQTWDNPMNTVDVADFILKMAGGNRPVGVTDATFTLDGKNIKTNDTIKVESARELQVSIPKSVTSREDLGEASISWGAVTGSFYEQTENIKANSTEGLAIQYELQNTNGSKKMKVGDKVRIVLTVTADRDMDFVSVDCQHPACFEPTDQHSGYRLIAGQGAYLSRHDSHTEVFFDTFRKGTHIIELEFYADREGTYQCGISTAKCTYCPDYSAHSNSQTVTVVH